MVHPCPLCREASRDLFFSGKYREFYRCPCCALVFVPPEYYLPEDREKERYDLHENSPENRGYVKFLSEVADIFMAHVKTIGKGLDFGSGPEPVFAGILRARGFDMSTYDPFFASDAGVFRNKYDLIALVEVMEHLKDPMGEIRRLNHCLEPGGVISIRTEMMPEGNEAFRFWSYKNDPTHICFYSDDTFRWLAETLRFRLLFPAPHVVLMFRI